MAEETPDFGIQQFNAGDLLKRYIVTQVFKTLDDACKKQETISEESHDTSFTTRVDMIEGLLWKYTPSEIRKVITELRKEMQNKIKQTNESTLSEKNKILTNKKASYNYSLEIFKLLAVVLTNSPISIEYVEMDIKGDFTDLIKSIRQSDRIKIFTEVST